MATAEHSASTASVGLRLGSLSAPDRPQALGRIGSWQLVRLLREGNLTRVYQACPAGRPDDPSPAYVLKVLRKEWWRDAQAIDMQRREAWAGMKVSHPNLLPVLAAGVSQPPFYVVTPLLAGSSLAEMLDGGRPLAVPQALWIARQVAEALGSLFETTKLIHTDVNPSNILVSPTGHATLIDLGLCQTTEEASRWSTRHLQGTLKYIAPEMLTSALTAGTHSDVYGLGATLYEMLAGRPPFGSDDAGELAILHRQGKPTCLLEIRPDLPKLIASLVHSMLAKDPARRPASTSQLVARLVRLEIDCFTLR